MEMCGSIFVLNEKFKQIKIIRFIDHKISIDINLDGPMANASIGRFRSIELNGHGNEARQNIA